MNNSTTVRAHRWPDSKGDYWVSTHTRESGYFPSRRFGRTYADGVAATRYGRELAQQRNVPFVSETGINTADGGHFPAQWETFEAARAWAAAYLHGFPSWRAAPLARGFIIVKTPGAAPTASACRTADSRFFVTWAEVDEVARNNERMARQAEADDIADGATEDTEQ